MNLFAIIIRSEMYYFLDFLNSEKNPILDEYISAYHMPYSKNGDEAFNNLMTDIMRDLNIKLMPVDLVDIYRPPTE